MPEFKAGLENIVVTNSDICWIDGQQGILLYRGYDIHDLATKATFEEVCYLLWYGKLPTKAELAELATQLTSERSVPQDVLDMISRLPKDEDPMSMLRTAVSYMGNFDKDKKNAKLEAQPAIARRLTAQFATVVAAIARARKNLPPVAPDPSLSHAANFLYMLTGEKPDEVSARTMDVALILHAEHGFNASTFTSRVIAATVSDMCSAVVGGIGALKGPLHGGANTGVMMLLLEIGEKENVEKVISEKLANKEKIMGMGHRVYKTLDPRATELQKLSKQMGERTGKSKWLEMSEMIKEKVFKEKGLYANVDFFSASTYYTMGIDPELFTLIFATSRISGWTAHIIEQLNNNRLIRPRAEYTGPMDLAWVDIDQRA